MARFAHMSEMSELFARQSSIEQKYYEEDDEVLDDDILNNDFATSDFSVDLGRPTPTKFSSNNPFASSFACDQSDRWEDASGATTPTALYENFSTVEYDHSNSTSYLAQPTSSAVSGTFDLMSSSQNHVRPVSLFPTTSASSSEASIPPSPLQGKDWMSSMATEQMDGRSFPKRMRQTSPRPSSSLMRRDGIRKKNARFEIPAERNLHNIDHLITQSTDDQEIKELKQQKRLLRNRQAALDSRQRKKQHTERLEEEKKQYIEGMTELEEKVHALELRDADHLQRESEWRNMQQQYEQFIENMRFEKEEMIRKHTLETAELRKKNAVLVEKVQNIDTPTLSTSSSSTAFTANDFADLDSSFMDTFSFDFVDPLEPKPSTSLVVPIKKEAKLSVNEDDKPAASSLLLILLLCGAFVASKGHASSSSSIPQMPDDIREASATVLDTIFKDAGVPQADPRLTHVNRVETLDNPPSASWSAAPASSSSMIGLSGSSLDILNQQLVKPTKEQEAEQLFSLTADQYNGVTSQDFFREPEPSSTSASSSQGRRNLGVSLAAMRENSKSSAAEVYTRSLMWDKVPAEVVRDFARLVADANRHDTPDGAE